MQRAHSLQWCDRKYDKHLSYSATWGRSAGRAGSGGVVLGAKIRPRGAASTLHKGLSIKESREGTGSSVRSWDTPRCPRPRTHEQSAKIAHWQDGGSSWSPG